MCVSDKTDRGGRCGWGRRADGVGHLEVALLGMPGAALFIVLHMSCT